MSHQTSWDTNRTTPFQFQNNLWETTYVNTCDIIVTNTRLSSVLFRLHAVSSRLVLNLWHSNCPEPKVYFFLLESLPSPTVSYRNCQVLMHSAECKIVHGHASCKSNRNHFWEKRFRWHNPSLGRRDRYSGEQQQTWTKQSLPHRCLCVGYPIKSDQAIRSLCLKGHVRARGSTLWRHRWQEAGEFFCTKTPLFGENSATKNITKKTRKSSLWRATNVMFSKFCGWRRNCALRGF